MIQIIKKQGISKTKEFAEVEWANIASTFALILVFGKSIFKIKKILAAFVLVFVFAFGTLAVAPYYYSYGTTTILCLYLISSFVYGSIFYSFRKSTLIENMSGTNLNKFQIYLSFFIIMFVFTAIVYLFIVVFYIIGIITNFPLFVDDFYFQDRDHGVGGHLISQLNAAIMIWWFVAFILLNFSLFYLFQNLVNTQKNFYSLIFFYFILLMIYGHSLAPPKLDVSYVLVEKYPEWFTKYYGNIFLYVGGIRFDSFLAMPNIDYPIDNSYHFVIDSRTVSDKFAAHHYIFGILTLLTPHYWIDVYTANVMKGTSLMQNTCSVYTHGAFWDNSGDQIQNISYKIDAFGANNYVYSYSQYNFNYADLWSFKNELSWILSMYLWIAYFILFYFMGTTISTIKKR